MNKNKRPALTFKDLDNIEYALWAVISGKLVGRKHKEFRKTYIKIYMSLRDSKPKRKTMPSMRRGPKR